LVGLKPDEVQGLPATENLKRTVWRARSADEKKLSQQRTLTEDLRLKAYQKAIESTCV